MRKLENLGIVKSRREGKSVYYRITNNDVVKVLDCLEGYKKKVAR
jgi:DNA-binding transcriptional ArsR family regulator